MHVTDFYLLFFLLKLCVCNMLLSILMHEFVCIYVGMCVYIFHCFFFHRRNFRLFTYLEIFIYMCVFVGINVCIYNIYVCNYFWYSHIYFFLNYIMLPFLTKNMSSLDLPKAILSSYHSTTTIFMSFSKYLFMCKCLCHLMFF